MKSIIICAISALTFAPLKGDDMTSIEQNIRLLFKHADAREWQALEPLFAPEVLLDYTSMGAVAAVTQSPAEITSVWKTVLPGFESTHHQLGHFDTKIQNDKATVSVNGLASHYLPNSGADIWTTVGTYDFELLNTDGTWRVALMRFNLRRQSGNLELAGLARKALAEGRPHKPVAAAAADPALINEFFDALEAKDIKRFMRVWSEDGYQIMPLAPDGFPAKLTGKEEVFKQYKGLPDAFSSMSFPREILTTSTPGLYVVRYQGNIALNGGGTYNNIYVGFFNIKNAKIQSFTEFFDPYVLQASFGQNLGEKFNLGQEVNMEKVSFISEGVILSGNLYRPQDFEDTKEYPVVVVAGTWTSVKEQMANAYAAELAGNGMMALSFDFRGYGESEGEPRNFENPEWKIQDIRNAVSYLRRLPEVAQQEVYGLGICAGAGYMAGAAAADERISSISLVAPWLHNQGLTHLIYGGEEGVAKLLQKSADAKEAYAGSGTVYYVPAVSTTDPEAAMFGEFDFYLDPERGAIAEWDGQFAVMAWEKWLGFDPIAMAGQVKVPTLIVHSEAAAIPDGAKQFLQQLKVKNAAHWTSGTQFDFYDNPAKISEAVSKSLDWFAQ